MALVKASEAEFAFPIIGFLKDDEYVFAERAHLLECAAPYYEDGDLIDVELVDAALRRWIIRSVDLHSPAPKRSRPWVWTRRPWPRFLVFPFMIMILPFVLPFIIVFGGNSRLKIDPVLEEVEPIPLEHLRERLCQSEIEAVGEDDEDEVTRPGYVSTLAELRSASSAAEMAEAIGSGRMPGICE